MHLTERRHNRACWYIINAGVFDRVHDDTRHRSRAVACDDVRASKISPAEERDEGLITT